MPTIFSRIVAGEIPSWRIAESDDYYAFLDINPIARGHTLVIPKREIDEFFDLPDDLIAGMMPFAKRVAAAIKAEVPCNRVGVAVVGLEVPHAHMHLIPIQGMHDIDFSRPKLELSSEEFEALAASIRARIEG